MSGAPCDDVLDISVVVLSYDRVHLLERTLAGVLTQTLSAGRRFEVVLVDNHPQRLAADLVTRLSGQADTRLSYLADARRNISVVRNKGIAAARGRYVAFIDDDEAPDAGWLEALVSCLDRTGADAAFGPKRPTFEAGAPPSWDPQGWRYTLDFQMPADTPIHLFGRLRKRGKGLGSGNAAFRVASCFDTDEPFNTAFGDANGEDTQLLFRLALSGKRFVWCPAAGVHEFIEVERARPDYMIVRMKRGSQHYAASRIDTSTCPILTRAKVTVLGLGQWLVHAGLFVASGEYRRPDRFEHQIGMAKGLGKLTYRKPIGFIEEAAS